MYFDLRTDFVLLGTSLGDNAILWRPTGGTVNQLVAYLLDNLILDFQGDLTLDMVRDFLRDDDSRESKALLARLVEDRGVSDMMICIADCLRESLSAGIRGEEVRGQLRIYAES
jgi:hypothetical protein